jgi:hypothetical protein
VLAAELQGGARQASTRLVWQSDGAGVVLQGSSNRTLRPMTLNEGYQAAARLGDGVAASLASVGDLGQRITAVPRPDVPHGACVCTTSDRPSAP